MTGCGLGGGQGDVEAGPSPSLVPHVAAIRCRCAAGLDDDLGLGGLAAAGDFLLEGDEGLAALPDLGLELLAAVLEAFGLSLEIRGGGLGVGAAAVEELAERLQLGLEGGELLLDVLAADGDLLRDAQALPVIGSAR